MPHRLAIVVALPAHSPLRLPLSYLSELPLASGSLVRVPLGQREVLGIVWDSEAGQEGAPEGVQERSIAAALSIAPSCVSKWKRRLAETGSLEPGRVGGRKKRTLSGERADWLRERCQSGPFTTRGLVAELAERGIKTDRRAVWVAAGIARTSRLV